MATTASSAANSASGYSIHDSSPIHDDPFSCDYENAVWNKSSNSSAEVGPESWPALSLSATPKSPSLESSKSLSDGSSSSSSMQVGGTAPNSTSNATVNAQRKPYRRNNNTSSSSTTNISNPPNARDQNRVASYGSGTTHFRNPHRNRGNRRNYEHGNQSSFSNPNHQRGIGMMRPMGPPSSSAQYMAAPQYGGPILYPDYAPHIFMPHPPPESMGHFSPLPMYFPSFDAIFYNKILTQVEYYFSADNLSRDKHLRAQMDDEGWVPVRVIAGFRRLAELTNNIQTILEAMRSSQVVEIKGETLRRRGDWDKYLLPREVLESGRSNASVGFQLERMTLSERSRDGE